MDLSTLIKEETISLSLEATDKKDVISKMANKMAQAGYISDVNLYTEAVFTREEKGSTGIGFQVAIPHGKSKGVSKPGLAFARLAQPTEWQSLDGQPVSMVFLIAVPEEQAGNEHLQILAALSRKLIHEEFRNQLMSAKTAQEVLSLIKTAS
ncbi:PTS sugar transporter subunit IIA [Tepidibacillus fermentans]|uniref:PTS system fructose-specific IIA component n=1 Tax=Tepidibacillus fermentans TaxID=1281767 RepID=A0A4R3KJH6_9BACI|nr:fructose PTS transporter subunit IIA [Tepidibacillus fermentans]TCS83846.1 PTS system fructose-specific IIA component [Tepidibacillus fermentans]